MEKKLYCCYSMPLMNFLQENGFRYEIVAKDTHNDKLFWVYMKSEKLDTYLKKWTANRPD